MYQTHSAKPETVGPIGCCIYDGSHSKDDLSKEHVLPHGLGGGVLLLRASCQSCRDITSAFEQVCLRQNFGVIRAQREMPTRRPNERQTHAKLHVLNNGEAQEKTVPLNEFPSLLMMPEFDGIPAYINGKTVPHSFVMRPHGNLDEVIQRAKLHTQDGFSFDFPFDIPAFLRLLAKIAHGMMWANFDTTNIRPLLRPIILDGNVQTAWNLIGRGKEFDIALNSEFGAGGHLMRCEVCSTPARGIFVLVTIQLFAEWGAPTYSVVAGECDSQPSMRKLRTFNQAL